MSQTKKIYNFQNNPSSDALTHFQGIYYAGDGVYEVPFDAITSAGKIDIGIAYIKRQKNGKFSGNALWQTFESPSTGELLSNDSVAGGQAPWEHFRMALSHLLPRSAIPIPTWLLLSF